VAVDGAEGIQQTGKQIEKLLVLQLRNGDKKCVGFNLHIIDEAANDVNAGGQTRDIKAGSVIATIRETETR